MAGTVKKLFFAEGVEVGSPTDLGIASSTVVISPYADDAAYVTANGAAISGSAYLNTTTNKLRYYTNSNWRNAVPESDSADPTKTFLLDLTGSSTGVSSTMDFNNTASRIYTWPNVAGTVVLSSALPSSLDVQAAGAVTIGASIGANDLTLGGASTTVVIPGNLTVLGTQTIINTTVLDVEDANITVNDGGDNTSAQGAGLRVERAGTHGSLIYDSAATSRFKIGDLASEVEIATISGAQVITNKDIDGGTASDTSRFTLPKAATGTLSALARKQATIVYDTTLNKPYYDNGSALVAFGSGSGSGTGSINYVTNGTFEDDATGWATYADAAASTPVDGTGGSPVSTFARNTTTPLDGSGDGKFVKGAANRQGEGFSYTMSVPLGYQYGQKSGISFAWNYDGTYVAGDMVVYVYDVTNSTLITPTVTSLPAAKTRINIAFDQSSTGASYRLIFHVATTSASAYNVYVDDVIVGPGFQSPVFPGSEWQSFTPTGSWSNTTYTGKYRRVGDQMEIRYKLLLTNSPSGALTVNLPSGFTIDTTKMVSPNNAVSEPLGSAFIRDTGTASYAGILLYSNSTSFVVRYLDDAAGGVTDIAVTHTAPFTFVNTDEIELAATVPIAEWAGNPGFTGQNDVEYASNSSTTDADDTSSFVYGPSGSSTPGALTTLRQKRVRFLTPIQSTDCLFLEINKTTTGDNWVSVAEVSHFVTDVERFSNQNATTYGLGVGDQVSSTDVDIYFGQYSKPSGATYASAGTAWSSVTNTKWRIKKTSAGQAVGFGNSSTTSRGLSYGISTLDGSSYGAIANNTFDDLSGTLTIPAGTYIIEWGAQAYIDHTIGSAPTYAECNLRVVDASNTNITGVTQTCGVVSTANDRVRGILQCLADGVVLSTTTTINLYGMINVTGGAGIVRNFQLGWIKATRTG